MKWVVDLLKQGKPVAFKPRGRSMEPLVKDGQLVTVRPIDKYEQVRKGDVVMVKVGRGIFLHLVSAVYPDGRVQISNNHGHVNGITTRDHVYGKLV